MNPEFVRMVAIFGITRKPEWEVWMLNSSKVSRLAVGILHLWRSRTDCAPPLIRRLDRDLRHPLDSLRIGRRKPARNEGEVGHTCRRRDKPQRSRSKLAWHDHRRDYSYPKPLDRHPHHRGKRGARVQPHRGQAG
jgi:hypothetical protein